MNANKILVGNPKGKRPVGERDLRWDYSFGINLKKWVVKA
jgi:hypothetical protein